jgi:hypothetical protein
MGRRINGPQNGAAAYSNGRQAQDQAQAQGLMAPPHEFSSQFNRANFLRKMK